MLSSANIEHGITLALIWLASIILLIIVAIFTFIQYKRKRKSNMQDIIIATLIFIGLLGLLYSCSG